MTITRQAHLLFNSDIPVNFKPIVVGRICSAYGVLGWLKIISFTEKFDQIMNYHPWYIQLFSSWCNIKLESWKQHGENSRFIIKIKKSSTRETAQILSNHEIFIDCLQLPPLNYGEYYWKHVIGCQVIGMSGYKFGVVVDLIATGSNDVLVVKSKQSGASGQVFLIPCLTTVIKHTDFLNNIICVEWSPNF